MSDPVRALVAARQCSLAEPVMAARRVGAADALSDPPNATGDTED